MHYLIAYAYTFINAPYKWGGETIDGIDCSGLVQEILASVGMDPSGDQTAQGLFNHFERDNNLTRGPGALCFYGESHQKVTHVGFMLDDFRMIEAGGGGSKILTREDAIKYKAFVRVRPYTNRKDLVAIIMPKYPEWVMNG